MSRLFTSARCLVATGALLAGLLLPAVPAFAAVDAFLVFSPPSNMSAPQVQGETLDKQFSAKHAIELREFSFGVQNPTQIGSATSGAGAGKAKFSVLTFKTNLDSATPSLFQACASGGHYDNATLYVRKASARESNVVPLQISLGPVWVSNINVSNSGGDETPTVTVELTYGGMRVKYTPQNVTGGPAGPPVTGEWSQVTNSTNTNLPNE